MREKRVVLGPYPPPHNGLSLCTKESFEQRGDFLLGTSYEPVVERDRVLVKKRFFPFILPRLLLEIKARSTDIENIEAHFATTFGYVAYLANKVWYVKYSVYAHGSDVLVNLRRPLLRHMTLKALRNADEIVAVSGKIKDTLINEGIEGSKIRVQYDKAEKGFKKLKLNKLDQIIFVGSVHPVKGLDTLLEAFRIVHVKFPKHTLLIVGKNADKKYHNKLRGLVKKYNLGKNVEFLGERKDIPELMNKSKLLVLPSRSEGYGRVLVEALACGLPIVATKVGGIPEIVKDGVNGTLVEPDSPKKMAAAIEKVLIKAK